MRTYLPIVFRQNPVAMLLLLLATIAMLAFTEGSNHRASELVQRLTTMATNRGNLYNLNAWILEAESGQRGYLITGRAEYLEPYTAALKNIDAAFIALEAAYSRDSTSAPLLEELHALTKTKLSELALTVQMQKDGKWQAGQEITLSGIGREYMNEIRESSNKLLEIETRHLQASQQGVSEIVLYGRIGVALLTTVCLFLVLLNLKHTRAFKDQQETHQRAMQAEQEHLQGEVERRTTQLVELNEHLQTAREDERHRIARDLHDELGALLTSAKLDVARIRSRLGKTAPEASERIDHLVDTLNAGIAMKRRIIDGLWPSSLSHLGLVATLEILAREFSKSTSIPVHCTLQAVTLDPTTQLVVYRLVQEATTNIAKYAQARNVWVNLACQDNHIEVCVRDDGIGFETSKIGSKSHGLLGMRLRVEAEEGTLELVSAPGQGTSIRARWPQAPSVPV